MLVVDASAVAELLLRRPAASHVEQHLVAHGFDLHAPHLLDVEVLSALRQLAASAEAAPARADAALTDFIDLPIERYPHDVLVPRVWELRDNFSAHDATYVALAEALVAERVPLLTADARLARATQEHTSVQVLLVR